MTILEIIFVMFSYRLSLFFAFITMDTYSSPLSPPFLDAMTRQQPAAWVVPVLPENTVTPSGACRLPVRYQLPPSHTFDTSPPSLSL